MSHVECIVIGAGAVGLAVAASIARSGMETVVLERHASIGQEVSSHNSEVIHAGIYYPTDSLKARLCVRGKELLYEHCKNQHVPHQRLGKIITACTPDQINQVRSLMELGQRNGVADLRWLDTSEIQELEPELQSVGGILSPSTGILDAHAFMQSLHGNLEANGGTVVFKTAVERVAAMPGKIQLIANNFEFTCNWVINCGGLGAPAIVQDMPGTPEAQFAKGHYYAYSGPSPFSRLIYPVPEGEGLGIHATLDMAGKIRFGPDVHRVPFIDYEFETSTLPDFVSAITTYYPNLDPSRLHPGYTGVRPKIANPKHGFVDFRILGPQDHGVPGCINLFGIESPGLTSSLAIAEHVLSMLSSR